MCDDDGVGWLDRGNTSRSLVRVLAIAAGAGPNGDSLEHVGCSAMRKEPLRKL